MDTLCDHNKEVYAEANNEVDAENTQETENQNGNQTETEIEMNLHTHVQNPFLSANFEELDWSGEFNPRTLDWIELDFVGNESMGIASAFNYLTGCCGKKKSKKQVKPIIPPLFTLRHLLNNASSERLRAPSAKFDPRIWVSNHFLPVIVGTFQTVVEAGSKLQRDLYGVLIHVKETEAGEHEIVSVGCLSQHDAAEFRKRLAIAKPVNGIKAFIYDMQNRSGVAGAEMDRVKLRKNPDLCLLEAQLKALNGDVSYHDDLMGPMIAWIKRSDHSVMSDALRKICLTRGDGKVKTLAGTDLDYILARASGVPEDEL